MRELDPLALPLDGRRLIEASAGTGKTYTITTLVLRLLLEEQLELEQILVVTYTRAATAELRARVRQRIATLHRALTSQNDPDDEAVAALRARSRERGSLVEDGRRIQRALYATDEAAIFTIHGFCQRVLGDYAFETDTPFALELRAHSQALVAEVVRDYWTHATQHIEPDLYAALRSHGLGEIESLVLRTLHGPLPQRTPVDVDGPRPDPAPWHDALRSVRERWQADREGFAAALQAAKVSLTERMLARVLPPLEQALGSDAPPLPQGARKSLDRILRAEHDAVDKGRPISHPLLAPLGALREADDAQCAYRDGQVRLLLWRAVEYAREQLSERSAARGEVTFDQLLSRTHTALTGPRRAGLVRALQRRYRAALIDEFQDTDPLQYEVFTRAFEGLPLLLIGDPKQAIYGFRGADVFAYLQAREGVGDAVYTLSTNRRSDPGLIAGLNHLYAGCEEPFALAQIRYVPVTAPAERRDVLEGAGAPVELLFLEPDARRKPAQEAELCERVATDIVHTLEAGVRIEGRRLSAGDIAILCRKNKQAHALQQALANRGVPSLLQGNSSVFDTPDALELERLLAALVDPGDARAVRGALAGVYLGLDAAQLDALSEDDAWERHRGALLDAHRTWLERGFIQGVRQCLRAYEVDERLMARPDGARRWTNLQHLMELLQEAALHERLGPDGVLRLHRTMRTDVATRQELLGESAQIRLESLEDAVRLTTVHRSKGLEYPVVYCPFAWEGQPPLPRFPVIHPESAPHTTLLELGSADREAHRSRAALEALADGLRVLYVALTRARHALRVVCGPLSGTAGGALQHLLGLGSKDDATTMREKLEMRCQGSHDSLTVRDLPQASDRRLPRATPAQVEARARVVTRELRDNEQVTSFTALSHGEASLGPVDEGVDHDILAAAPMPTPGQAESFETVRAETPPLAMQSFPRGPAAGTVVHELLERSDFSVGIDALVEQAADLLPRRGLPRPLAPALGAALHDVLHTPLDGGSLRLCDLAKPDVVPEMEFIFRVRPQGGLDGRGLAGLLRAHGAPAPAPRYTERIERLSLDALGGFLRGFIDLVFHHEGRFFVVDYKSNDLGASASDYVPSRLAEAMGEHHYYLQYLLYTIAVHRHLRARVPGYAYESHFGGVYYLFLRGMAPERGPDTGVFFDRPTAALVTELEAALDQGATTP